MQMYDVNMKFKFKTGDMVQHVIAGKFSGKKFSLTSHNVAYFVLERVYQECSGGYQVWYECRGVVEGGSSDSRAQHRLREDELELWQPQANEDAIRASA